MMVWMWYDWMIVVWWFGSCVCEWVQLKKLQTVVNKVHTLFLVFFKLRNTTQSTSLSFRFLQLFHFTTWLKNFLKTRSLSLQSWLGLMLCILVSPWRPWRAKVFFFILSFINNIKNIKRSSGSSSKVRIGTNSNRIAAEDHPYTIFRFSTQVFMVFRNGGVRLLFFQPLINTNFTKIFFSRPNLKERMSFRDGIIFKISSPHTEKIYIGCSSLPLNRAVSGLRAGAKFRKLSCNILFQAGDIQSEILEKFQDITVLEMRKKLGAIQTQYLEKCVNTNRAGRTNADRYRETKRQLEMYRENKDMFNRKHALKNMRIRGLPPRPSTILKYNITDEEIADCCKRV